MDQASEVLKPAGVDLVKITTDVVAAYLSNNHVQVAELPSLLASVHAALRDGGQSPSSTDPEISRRTPSQIRKSIRPDALISFEDGKPYKTLKRHITKLGLSPVAYREKWGLPRDYPMTAASYSEQRSKLAISLGLGQRHRKSAPTLVLVAQPTAETSERNNTAASSAKPATRRKPTIAVTV